MDSTVVNTNPIQNNHLSKTQFKINTEKHWVEGWMGMVHGWGDVTAVDREGSCRKPTVAILWRKSKSVWCFE